MGQSIWSSMQQKGYSRREFMQFCAAAATVAGLGQSGVAQVVSAFEKKEKPAVVWLHPKTRASLSRCAQPMPGISASASSRS